MHAQYSDTAAVFGDISVGPALINRTELLYIAEVIAKQLMSSLFQCLTLIGITPHVFCDQLIIIYAIRIILML